MVIPRVRVLRKGRPGIVGFREHIFSAVGLLGRIAADSEFTFGTMIQRTGHADAVGAWIVRARLSKWFTIHLSLSLYTYIHM